MPDKPWTKLNELDRLIRGASPIGMDGGVKVTIEFFTGFELFNTRPYHNYETFSGGYRVKGMGHEACREDLDDAVKEWASLVNKPKQPIQ